MNTDQQPRRKHMALSHPQFYAACECLKKNKQQFLDSRPKLSEAAEMLTKLVGFSISKNSITDIQKAIDVDWEPRRKSSKNPAGNSVRVLTTAVLRLYKKLGEEVPETLQRLYDHLNIKSTSEKEPEGNNKP